MLPANLNRTTLSDVHIAKPHHETAATFVSIRMFDIVFVVMVFGSMFRNESLNILSLREDGVV
jgi:hypothetical protein